MNGGASAIAESIALGEGGWTFVAFADDVAITRGIELLRDELRFVDGDDDDEREVELLNATQISIDDVVYRLRKKRQDDTTIVFWSPFSQDQSSRLDVLRNALIAVPCVVFAMTAADSKLISPNTWSWIAARHYTFDFREGVMDTEKRLASLRQEHGLTDEEVIAQSKAGTLPSDPAFAEWLILLQEGDLLGKP